MKFKDQPWGDCLNCRWNDAFKHGPLSCDVPETRLRNPVCIIKRIGALAHNIDWELKRQNQDIEDGEEWKKGEIQNE